MTKSRDAFRTISEVSDWLDTPAHVLRFWESKFSQIKPVKRAGGRRYYRPDDMALLSGIKYLLHEQGMTIKGAQKLLREQGVRHVADLGMGAPAIDTDVIDAVVTPPATASPVPHPAPPSDPASWDPDDPWPADPATSPDDVFDEAAAPTEPEPEPEPLAARIEAPGMPHPEAAPVMSPPQHEVSVPLVRARAEAATPPEAQTPADILSFGQPARPPLPDMPDESALHGRPGALTALMGADPARLQANAARIAPLAARLRSLSDGMGQAG